MLVDNEPDVIELFTEILKTNGYKVLGFVDPRLAFEHLKQNQEEFKLVLSDYRVRYLSGCDLVRKITEKVEVPEDLVQPQLPQICSLKLNYKSIFSISDLSNI